MVKMDDISDIRRHTVIIVGKDCQENCELYGIGMNEETMARRV